MDRNNTRFLLFKAKHGLCDVCRNQAYDLHEIINRARTLYHEDARELSYEKELCSLLCRNCHEKAHNPTWQEGLLSLNIHFYGESIVRDKYDQVCALVGVSIPFPDNDLSLLQIRKVLLNQ